MLSRNRGLDLRVGFGFAALAAILAPTAALAAPWAYTVQFGNLVRADLGSGRVEVVGPTGIAGLTSSMSLADDGAGHFYSLSLEPGASTTHSLFRLDAASGAAVRIGLIGGLLDAGLEFGPDGQLYLGTGATLYQVDPASAAFTPLFGTGSNTEYLSLGTAGGALYGIYYNQQDCDLVRLDPAARSVTPVLAGAPCAFSMAGDAAGRLWLVSDGDGVITGTFSLRVDVLDPATLQLEPWSGWGGFESDSTTTRLLSLAAVGQVNAVDVPVAGPAGLAVLALALLAAGLAWLNRP